MYNKQDKTIPINEKEMSIIIGTVLGDGTLTKSRNKRLTANLRLAHCLKQKAYCEHKASHLIRHANKGTYIVVSKINQSKEYAKTRKKTNTSIRFESRFTTDMYTIYDLFYVNGKKIIPDNIADLLTPESVAIWYMDDGSIETIRDKRNGIIYYIKNAIRISTNGFTERDCIKLKDALESKFGLKLRLKKVDYGKHFCLYSKNRKTIEQFIRFIKPFLIDEMLYKIKTSYQKPMKKKYTKEKAIKIALKLKLIKRKDFTKYRRGSLVYESLRHYFGKTKKFQDFLENINLTSN